MQVKAHLFTFKGKGGVTQTPCTAYKSISMSLEEHRGTLVGAIPISHAEKSTLPSPRTVPGKLQPHGPSGPLSQGKVLSHSVGWQGKKHFEMVQDLWDVSGTAKGGEREVSRWFWYRYNKHRNTER